MSEIYVTSTVHPCVACTLQATRRAVPETRTLEPLLVLGNKVWLER